MVNQLLRLFERNPQAGLALGGLIAVVSAVLGWGQWRALQAMPSEPARTEVAAAAALAATSEQLVTLEGATWHCEDAMREGSSTYIPVTDRTGDQLVVLVFNRKVDCATASEQPVSGLLHPIRPRFLSQLTQGGLTLTARQAENGVRSLCTYCGRDNTRLGVILSGVFLLIGLALYPLALALHRKAMR